MTDPGREGATNGEPVRDEYEMTLLLERLESLIEEMDEAGVADRAAAEGFPALREEMDDLGIASRAEAVARSTALSARLDTAF